MNRVLFSGNAAAHPTSLAGKHVKFDLTNYAHDIKTIYGQFNPHTVLTVTTDNEGKVAQGTSIRMISFQDEHGTTASGNAARFDVYSLQ